MSDYQKYYRPLGNKVMVNPIPLKEKTASGIFLPVPERNALQKGIVMSKGDGTPDCPMEVKFRDLVIFHHKAGITVDFNGNKFRILKQTDIIGIL